MLLFLILFLRSKTDVCFRVKDCGAIYDNDTSRCIPGLFGGRPSWRSSAEFCNTSEKVFRPSLFPVACIVQDKSAVLGLFHYPAVLARERRAFALMGQSVRHYDLTYAFQKANR